MDLRALLGATLGPTDVDAVTSELLRCMSLFLALNGPSGMSAQWSLSGGKQTWGGPPTSVAINPKRTCWAFPVAQPALSHVTG